MATTTAEVSEEIQRLQRERDAHRAKIANTSYRQLRQMRRPNYVPRLRTTEELKREVRFRKSWRTPGPVNSFFMAPPIPRAKILDTWTASRV